MVQLITQRSNQNPTTKYNVIESDPSCFFDGEGDSLSSFDGELSSEAGGLKRWIRNRRSIQRQRQRRKNLKASSKAQARTTKAKAKQTQAQSQRDMARVLGSQGGADAALAASMASPIVPEPTKSKTGLYVGLGVAGVAIIGLVAFFILKNKKGGK